MNRRRLLEILGLATVSSAVAAAPVEAVADPALVAPPLPVGMIMPRFTHRIVGDVSRSGAVSREAVVLYEYQIWSGSAWLELNSREGAEVRRRVMEGGYDAKPVA